MMDKPDTGTWNSIDDALGTFYSFSRVTKGSGPKSGDFSSSYQSAGSSKNESGPDLYQDQNESHHGITSDEGTVNEALMFGGGRGQRLQNIQKQLTRETLDETLGNEIKMVTGTDSSNAAIERYFDSICSSSSSSETRTQETGVFSDPYTEDDEEQGEVDIIVGESSIMQKITAHEKLSARMKKPPRCRNAIVLNLTEKKSANETEQETKKGPELKGPDLFLPNKSYSNIVSAGNSSNINQTGRQIFNDEDFPAL